LGSSAGGIEYGDDLETPPNKGATMNGEMIFKLCETLRKLPIRDQVAPGGELDQLRLREAARAILATMKSPTAEMLSFGVGNKDAKRTWELMVDAALRPT
jgi:hypothetical protein